MPRLIWIIAALIPLTALMMGAVHPWALIVMEEGILALVVTWIARTVSGRFPLPRIDRTLRLPLIGLVLFLSMVALQLLPLPPRVEALISPATYRLYQISLPGWPEAEPYSWLLKRKPSGEAALRASQELSGRIMTQAALPSVAEKSINGDLANRAILPLPISVAPSMTKVALLKLLACLLLGVLVVVYPFTNADSRLIDPLKALVRTLLGTGLVLGLIGLLLQFMSNGKPLWIFTPYDFRGRDVWNGRAFGTFANPDHYACFLAMLLPPALAGIIFPRVLGKVRERAAVPLLCGVVAIVIITALLATASRGGMLNAVAGIVVFGLLCSRLPAQRLPEVFQVKRRKNLILAGGAVCLLTLAVFLAGKSNQTTADARLKASFSTESISGRLVPAGDSLRMVSDFPVFGVGLGAWPDLYRKYTRPPWSPVFMNAAHNEYVQLLAETGAVGFLIVAAVGFAIGRRAKVEIFHLPGDQFAVIASFVASLAGLAIHAALDFPLRVPAIAVLATIMCGFVIRATSQQKPATNIHAKPNGTIRLGAMGIIIGLLAVMWIVTSQPRAPYPYDLKSPDNYAEMAQLLIAHPVNSRVHMTLIGFLNTDIPDDKIFEELKTSVVLEPNNPLARDMYLQALARQGRSEAALDQMRQSVFRAPTSTDHFYLSSTWVPKLTAAERNAIENGLHTAVSDGFHGAIVTLGDFYEEVGEYKKEAKLFIDSGGVTHDSEEKAELLSRAGRAFARAGDYKQAQTILQTAIQLRPQDTTAYEYLSLEVNVPEEQFATARLVLNQGIQAGGDPARLYLKLAEVNRAANDKGGEEEALKQAANLQPFNFEVNQALGDAYLTDGRVDEAVLWLKKATEVNSSSAEAIFELAQAEESAYQFSAAQSDYARAVAIEPGNLVMRARFEQFKERVAASSRPN